MEQAPTEDDGLRGIKHLARRWLPHRLRRSLTSSLRWHRAVRVEQASAQNDRLRGIQLRFLLRRCAPARCLCRLSLPLHHVLLCPPPRCWLWRGLLLFLLPLLVFSRCGCGHVILFKLGRDQLSPGGRVEANRRSVPRGPAWAASDPFDALCDTRPAPRHRRCVSLVVGLDFLFLVLLVWDVFDARKRGNTAAEEGRCEEKEEEELEELEERHDADTEEQPQISADGPEQDRQRDQLLGTPALLLERSQIHPHDAVAALHQRDRLLRGFQSCEKRTGVRAVVRFWRASSRVSSSTSSWARVTMLSSARANSRAALPARRCCLSTVVSNPDCWQFPGQNARTASTHLPARFPAILGLQSASESHDEPWFGSRSSPALLWLTAQTQCLRTC
eukprot:2937672-Rhodomonas_salina.1